MTDTAAAERTLTTAQKRALADVRTAHGTYARSSVRSSGHQHRVLQVLVEKGLAAWDPTQRYDHSCITPEEAQRRMAGVHARALRDHVLIELGLGRIAPGFYDQHNRPVDLYRLCKFCACPVLADLGATHALNVHGRTV